MQSLVYLPENKKDPITLNTAFEKMGMNISRRATFLIPDLQRGYVWKTKAITNLVDSLLKGWPFGQILIANTGELSPYFSPRTFYSKLVDGGISTAMEIGLSKDTCLILDGQQRLQSLFLALSPCSGGVIFDQRKWMEEYKKYTEYKGSWSGYKAPTAYLALNVSSFCEAMDAGSSIENVNYSSENPTPVLEWVFDRPDEWSQLRQRQHLLPHFLHNPWDPNDEEIRFIVIKDFWEANTFDDLLRRYHVPVDRVQYVNSFYERINFLKKLEIPYTKILFSEECECNEDKYSEMIISIFTRLNAGGISLSREDITFSWIKRYWGDRSRPAEVCLRELRQSLAQHGFSIESDYLIRLLSNIWATIEHEGKPLVAQDFLNGQLLKQVAVFLQKNWNTISTYVSNVAEILQTHGIRYQSQFYSLDGFFLVVIWQTVAKLWAEGHPGEKQYSSVNFDSLFNAWIEPRIDRMIFAGQWGNSYGNYILSLNKLFNELQSIHDYEQAYKKLSGWFEDTLGNCVVQAKNNIANLNRRTRAGVSAYTTHLWCWQRLDESRKNLSKKLGQARGGISAGEPNVDHCVAFNFWQLFIAKFVPDGSDEFNEKLAQINQMGNCNILSKSINCSKSDYTMKQFFTKLQLGLDEAGQLAVPEEMFAPDAEGLTPDVILEEIEKRTKRIKDDLCDFLDGKKNLCR